MEINTKYFYFRLNEWHHLYTGIIVAIIGIHFYSLFLWTLGWVVLCDDIGQHMMQGILQDKNYHTPFHYAGKPLYILREYLIKKYGWNWLDRL